MPEKFGERSECSRHRRASAGSLGCSRRGTTGKRETTEEGGERRGEREHSELSFFEFSDSNTIFSSLDGSFFIPFFHSEWESKLFLFINQSKFCFLLEKKGKKKKKKRKRAPLCIHPVVNSFSFRR